MTIKERSIKMEPTGTMEFAVKYKSIRGNGEIIAVYETLGKAMNRRDQLKKEGVEEIQIVGRWVGEWFGLM